MDFLHFFFGRECDDCCRFSQYRKTVFKKHPSEEQIDFFYPNACQVCGRLGNLIRCAKCQMINYCGKQHQTEHWHLHKYFCTLIADLRRKNSFLRNAKDRKLETWTNAKIASINSVSKKLGRTLTSYEEKVIKFTRSCCICHDIDQRNLINCPNCASVSICHSHKSRFHEIHSAEKCANFQLCYQLDREKLQLANEKAEMKKNPKVDKKKKNDKYESDSEYSSDDDDDEDSDDDTDTDSDTTSDSDDNSEKSNIKITELKTPPMNLVPYFENLPKSTKNFLEFLSFPLLNNMRGNDFEIPDLFLKPLSVFRSLQILEQLNNQELTIHLIDEEINDLETCDFWEALFHLMPNLKSLKIIIFHEEFSKQRLSPKLCEKCTETEKTLLFELKAFSYVDYCNDKTFLMPNLVIGFLTLLKLKTNALKAIANLKTVPLALTSNCEKLARDNNKFVEKLFGKSANHHFYEENLFCGLKPILDFKTDGFYFENQFLTIYKGFNESEVKRKMNGIKK
ncbi:uncharacterized protein LOC122510082 [Leptopilina heterotoma]|uniref:uncharacterized protein LOC122510082 n=1 Tax=Leptopilina heterotoma TaxID=63436 RepID=UPI001CA8DC64|nr:uncharacterized protein LOC122510082 [Leptopilina heterotoma]